MSPFTWMKCEFCLTGVLDPGLLRNQSINLPVMCACDCLMFGHHHRTCLLTIKIMNANNAVNLMTGLNSLFLNVKADSMVF